MKLLCIFVVSCTTVIVGASSRPTEISSSASLPASNHGHHHFDPVVNAIIEPSSDAVSVAYPNGNDGDNTPAFLRGIMLVATGNLLLNIFRPDPVIVWQASYVYRTQTSTVLRAHT